MQQAWWLADIRARVASIRSDVAYWRRRGWIDTAEELSRVAAFVEETIEAIEEPRRVADVAEAAEALRIVPALAVGARSQAARCSSAA